MNAGMTQQKTLRVFIDTEFTDFINTDLISIGAAAENGSEFYGENLSYIKSWQTKWVGEHVVPLLDPVKFGMSRQELSTRLWVWIDELPCDNVIIMVDHKTDEALLLDLFNCDKHPKISAYQNLHNVIYSTIDAQMKDIGGTDTDYHNRVTKVQKNFKFGFANYFDRTREIQHHALSDAKANREAWNCLVLNFGMP